jgi:aspartate aminotransferase
MKNLNDQIAAIQGSPTLALNETARSLKDSGADVINLAIGEPLNEFPVKSLEYAHQKLNTRQIKYGPTGGIKPLKVAVQEYTETLYGRTPHLHNITITVGAKQAIHNLLYTILNPGDEVIMFTPYWVSYPEIVKINRGIPVYVPTNDQFIPEMEQLLPYINERTKAILVNSPNNPTGSVYPAEFVAALVDYCETKEIFLILDDIYHQLVFGHTQWVPGYVFTSQTIDKSYLIIVNGISKTYGMTGFRVGWAVGPEIIIKAMEKLQSHTTSGASVLNQEAALGALRSGDKPIQELRESIESNKKILVNGLMNIKGIKLAEPGGTFYCFPDFREFGMDSNQLASLLLEKAFVATVPGSAFGMEGYLRLSYTCSKEQVEESTKRIRWILDPDSPREISIGGITLLRNWERDLSR